MGGVGESVDRKPKTNADSHAIFLSLITKNKTTFLMGIKAWIPGRMHRHPIMRSILGVGAALGSIFLLTEGIKKIRYAQQLLQEIINAGITTTIKSGNVVELQLRFWFIFVLSSLIIVLVVIATLYLRAQLNWKNSSRRALRILQQGRRLTQLKLQEIRESKLKHAVLAEKTLAGMMAASLEIRNDGIQDANAPPAFHLDVAVDRFHHPQRHFDAAV